MKKKSVTKKLSIEKLKITKLSNARSVVGGGSEFCANGGPPLPNESDGGSCTFTVSRDGNTGNRPSQVNCG